MTMTLSGPDQELALGAEAHRPGPLAGSARAPGHVHVAAGPMTGFDADGINAEFFGDGRYTALAVVNIGRPGEGAWSSRAPRLDYEEAVSSV